MGRRNKLPRRNVVEREGATRLLEIGVFGMRERDIGIAIAVIVVVILLLGLLGGGAMMGPGMMGYGYGYGWWMWIAMAIFWGLILVGIALVLFWLLRQARPIETGPAPGAPRPIDILRERYARGEITREQFEQMRRDLEGSS